MAIVQEIMEINGTAFVRTVSDANRYVVRDGVSYSEAYDPASFGRVYTEGEPMGEMSAEEQALTRYSNELTGANNTTLQEATETLIKQLKEGK